MAFTVAAQEFHGYGHAVFSVNVQREVVAFLQSRVARVARVTCDIFKGAADYVIRDSNVCLKVRGCFAVQIGACLS